MTASRLPVLLEVCIASEDDAVTAARFADRLELNSALELDGLTPSLAMIEAVLAAVGSVPVVAMCRPRAGGFVYPSSEWRVLLRDAERAIELGASGVAFGAMTAGNQVDLVRCREMVRLMEQSPVGSKNLTFHRAFDVSRDLDESLEALIDTGITRVMTSGGAASAWAGRDVIARLVARSAGRIEILAASGIRPENAKALIQATGCQQIHGSFREDLATQTGLPGAAPSMLQATSAKLLRDLQQALGSSADSTTRHSKSGGP